MLTQNTNHLNWRYATKKFDSNREVSEQDLSALLEVLRLSPSSFGLQPWKFLVIKDRDVRQKLVEHSWNQNQIVDASYLIVLCSYQKIDAAYVAHFCDQLAAERNTPRESLQGYEQMMSGFIQRLSSGQLQEWMKNQVYLALGFLMNEAAHRQIDTCPMEGFDSAAYDKILELESQNLKSVVLSPVGYRASDDKHAALKKVRFPSDRVIEYR